jgi:hypothetical protein
LQIDLPVLGKPFGFAVDQLWLVPKGKGQKAREVFEAPAGSCVEVGMPHNHPAIPPGAPVYCSSSQAVKQKYRHDRPKPGSHRVRSALAIDAILTGESLKITAQSGGQECRAQFPGPFDPCQDLAAMEAAIRAAFARLGDSPFDLSTLTFANEACGFIPMSRLNQVRREILNRLQHMLQAARAGRIAAIQREVRGETLKASPTAGFRWSIKVDRMAHLDAFEPGDWQDVDEVIVDIARDHTGLLRDKLAVLENQVGRERIRLALPALTRQWEENALLHKIQALRHDGWPKWEAANLSAWSYLSLDPTSGKNPELDLATDWSIYVLNRLAALQLIDMGVTRFALSPEDGLANWKSLLAEFGPRAVVIVYQDTPLFLAESCAYANLIGGCPGKANCNFQNMEMISSHGEKVTALDYHCRTIVLNQAPYCLSTRLPDLARAGAISLRADFIYREYEAAEVVKRWRLLRAGKRIAGGHAANLDRGIF